jgi:hypothetical protein
MKFEKLALSLATVLGLAACSTPVQQSAAVQATVAPVANITQYRDSSVNEAASAYVSLYKNTIDQSLAAQKYKSDLAYKHLSAEACFDSRAYRLLAKEFSREEKDALVLAYVSKQRLIEYAALSQGHFSRVNGLELFSCGNAGLNVEQSTVKG